jgi:hypothetical protein
MSHDFLLGTTVALAFALLVVVRGGRQRELGDAALLLVGQHLVHVRRARRRNLEDRRDLLPEPAPAPRLPRAQPGRSAGTAPAGPSKRGPRR